MLDQFENTYLKVIRGERTGFFADLFKCFLHPFSWFYALATSLKNGTYDFRLIKSYRSAIPAVVSIGNITVGGTGKTPITQMLAQAIAPHFKVAILSRGYRSVAESSELPVVLKGENPENISAKFCGDEPYQLWKNLPDTTVYVCKNRCASANQAACDGMQLAILDDGMQHRKLARDFELVVLDAADPFGQGYSLPRGLLRERPGALKRADLIIINHVHNLQHFHTIREQIKHYTQAPVIAARVAVKSIKDLEKSVIDTLQGKKVGLFCAIGSPHHFKETLISLGANVIDQLILSDHRAVDEKMLSQFAERCRQKGAELLVCTEKDQIKLDKTVRLSLPIAWTEIILEFIEGSNHWEDLIQKIINKINSNKH